MKRRINLKPLIIFAAVTLITTAAVSSVAYAHSGKTDSSGGHYDHDTGEYHYHHGHPAHQHTDMDGDGDLDCPYDFDDATDHSSSSSSSSSSKSYSSFVAPEKPVATFKPVPTVPISTPMPTIRPISTPKPTPRIAETTNLKKEDDDFVARIFAYFFGFAALVLFVMWSSKRSDYKYAEEKYNSEKERFAIQKKHIEESAEKAKKDIETKCALSIEKQKNEFAEIAKIVSTKPLEDLAGAPENDYIGEDGLPYSPETREGKYGKYTLYKATYGRHYHKRFCDRSASEYFNSYKAKKLYPNLSPCSRCNPTMPDMGWVDRYYTLKNTFDRLGVKYTTRQNTMSK